MSGYFYLFIDYHYHLTYWNSRSLWYKLRLFTKCWGSKIHL